MGRHRGLATAGGQIASAPWRRTPPMPRSGAGFAWAAHFGVERNRPAIFTYPRWSPISDYRMYCPWLSGRPGPDLRVAGVA
ncbi:Mpo1-like protein [Sphingomonas hylomeconis]|uniref:Mpo1-like protein n=2 Tax=Sphingomonas hylomeconis TaxID=1395958 RepID=A0ABV7SXP4_9SPHN